jgi:hypothetical protein
MVLIGIVTSWIGVEDLDKFVAFVGWFVWFVYPCSYVSTECANESIDFVAYAMSIRPRCTTRRVDTTRRKQNTVDIILNVFGLVVAAMRLFQ